MLNQTFNKPAFGCWADTDCGLSVNLDAQWRQREAPTKQGKALCDSLIKQRKCELSLARRSSWQNWSFARGSSQDGRLCSPHNTEMAGLFLTSSRFLFYNSTLSLLDALPVSRPGWQSVRQSVGRSVATVSEFGPRWLEERRRSTQQRYCFHCSLWTTPIIADWKYVAANKSQRTPHAAPTTGFPSLNVQTCFSMRLSLWLQLLLPWETTLVIISATWQLQLVLLANSTS